MSVYAFTDAKDNADLILKCVELGYLHDGLEVFDATYGPKGGFWTRYRPAKLSTNDQDPACDTDLHFDFRKLPLKDRCFDVVAFDPDYGYRGTSRLESDKNYGIAGKYKSVAQREKDMADGMTECVRILRSGGRLLMKCQDQSVSGDKRFQTIMFANLGEHLGVELEDMLHLPSLRAQPAGKEQKHSWANYSTLLVLRKP